MKFQKFCWRLSQIIANKIFKEISDKMSSPLPNEFPKDFPKLLFMLFSLGFNVVNTFELSISKLLHTTLLPKALVNALRSSITAVITQMNNSYGTYENPQQNKTTNALNSLSRIASRLVFLSNRAQSPPSLWWRLRAFCNPQTTTTAAWANRAASSQQQFAATVGAHDDSVPLRTATC